MASPLLRNPDAERLAELYERYQSEPGSVEPDWQEFFGSLDRGAQQLLEGLRGGTMPAAGQPAPAAVATPVGDARDAAHDSIRAMALINAYRTRGHLEADLDPLGLRRVDHQPDLDPGAHGFSETDLDRPIFVNGELGLDTATPREIVRHLRRIYCGSAGVEFMHIQDPDQKAWILGNIEAGQARFILKPEVKRDILVKLTMAEVFERFLHRKFVATKRFGLDGAESVVPALEAILMWSF